MKYFILLIVFVLISCNDIVDKIANNEINFNTDYFIENEEYEVSINSLDTSLYLYCSMYSNSKSTFKSEYFRFDEINNKLVSKVKFSKDIYKVEFFIAKNGKIEREYDKKIAIVLNPDSSLKKQSYINILNSDIEFNDGLKLIDEFKEKYPRSLEIYPMKWKFEAINKINKKESLKKDLEFIENFHTKDGNYYFVQFIGNKLLGDNLKADLFLDSLTVQESEYFNDPTLYPIISKLLDVGYTSKNNNNNILNNIYQRNPISLFTLKNVTSLYYKSKDSSLIDIYDTLLKEYKYFYPTILLSKFRYLTYLNVDSNNNVLKRVYLDEFITEFDFLYSNLYSNNSLEFLKNNKYGLFEFITYNLVLNFVYSYYFVNSEYNKSIETALKIIDRLSENDLRVKFSTLLFIGDVYLKKLDDLTNAKKYYFLAKSLNIKEEYINKKLLTLFKRFDLKNISFEEWIQINLEKMKNDSINNYSNSPNIVFTNNINAKVYDSKKKTLIIFTTFTCSVCKYVYKEIENNKKWYEDNFRIIYISREKQEKLNILNKKYNTNMQEIINGKELFNYYDIGGVPVVVINDEKGKQIYKEEGANKNWTLKDLNF